jgi:hypothetical protein
LDGTWQSIHDELRDKLRVCEGKLAQPSAGIMDSQSVKTAQGYDATKKVKGRKRHILVDSLGLILSLAVLEGNIRTGMGPD